MNFIGDAFVTTLWRETKVGPSLFSTLASTIASRYDLDGTKTRHLLLPSAPIIEILSQQYMYCTYNNEYRYLTMGCYVYYVHLEVKKSWPGERMEMKEMRFAFPPPPPRDVTQVTSRAASRPVKSRGGRGKKGSGSFVSVSSAESPMFTSPTTTTKQLSPNSTWICG